jgi:importin subunit alpha-1
MTDREYKAAGAKDVDSIRRTKKQESVQLRKQKREERLLEKRATLTHLTPETKIKYPPPSIEDLPQLAQQVYSEDLNVLQYSTTQIRRLLSSSKTVPPLKKVIDTGIIPRLVQLMNSDDEILRIETAWTLTNIASGTQEQTRCVVDANSIPIFIKLLYDSNLKVAEQAMWALGNIAGDCPELRDLTMNHGILEPLMVHLSTALTNYEQVASHEGIESDEDFKANVTLMRTFTWTLSNLCRGKNPSADLQRLLPALPLLARFLQ